LLDERLLLEWGNERGRNLQNLAHQLLVLIQLHILVHGGDALLQPGLKGRNLVPRLIFLFLLRFMVAQGLLQLLDAVLRVLAVF